MMNAVIIIILTIFVTSAVYYFVSGFRDKIDDIIRKYKNEVAEKNITIKRDTLTTCPWR